MQSMAELQTKIREGFTDWEQYGNVKAVYHQSLPLIIFNYTHAAQFEGRWNWFERVCRGLIFNTETGEIVARPFDKFFNWGEGGHRSTGHIITVTEKIDGSLGILYRDGNHCRISTRGTFDSEQAAWATSHLNAYYDLCRLPLEYTLLFEIVYPENRIVVDYGGDEDLFLLAIRNRFTGEYLPFYPDTYEWAEFFGFPTPKTFEFNNVVSIMEACESLDGTAEGWVAEFSDGQRFKFKGDAYVELHRLVTNTTFKRVLSWVADGSYDAMIDGVPEEFLGQVREWKRAIDLVVAATKMGVEYYFHYAPKATRKDFAIWINENVEERLIPYLFKRWEGKDYTSLVYKREF
jgi:RNA ligase